MEYKKINKPYHVTVATFVELQRLKVMFPHFHGSEIVEMVIWGEVKSGIKESLLQNLLYPGYVDSIIDILNNFKKMEIVNSMGDHRLLWFVPNTRNDPKRNYGKMDLIKQNNKLNRAKILKWVKDESV